MCRLCGGERRVIAQIEEGRGARKTLEHLGLPTRVPVRAPARGQAQGQLWATGPPERAEPEVTEADEPPPFDFDQRTAEPERPTPTRPPESPSSATASPLLRGVRRSLGPTDFVPLQASFRLARKHFPCRRQ